MNIILKNIEIVIISSLFFDKMSECTVKNYKNIIKYALCFVMIAIGSILDNYVSYLTMFILSVTFCLGNVARCRGNESNILLKSILSFGLSYVSFTMSVLISGIILLPLPNHYWEKYGQLLPIIIQIIMLKILFSIKRLNKSFKLLFSGMAQMLSWIIGVSVILISCALNYDKIYMYYMLVFIFVIIGTVIIFIIWRGYITKQYLYNLSIRNIDSLNAELVEKNEYIERVLEDKHQLEKLNHKNYKLVPAMQGAVMHYLDGVKELVEAGKNNPALAELAATKDMTVEDYVEEGNRLIKELQRMQDEWTDFVNNENVDGSKDIPESGIPRLDYILSYMYERSKKEDYTFKVDIDCELKGLTEKIITEEDLSTLVADLIENAIIATKYNEGKYILVSFGMMKKEYIIDIYDSGIPFDKEVLAKYGQEQITTHADDSGSGIGMMQTYEILSKCGASLFIDEFSQDDGMYTKRLSVVFNKKQQYVLYTKRGDDDISYLKKRSDLTIVKK